MNARAEESLHSPTICPASSLRKLLEIAVRSIKVLQIVASIVTMYSGVSFAELPADCVLLIALAFENAGVAYIKKEAGVAPRKIGEPLS